MSKSNLFIPRKIKVGFQNRNDTYTGRLAYVIYYDNKEKLRKETSWQNWRDKNIDPMDLDNTPTEGFVLNKKVGGYSNGWGDFRQAYVRVYDPRGFEFEITVPNLLFILEHSSSIKGKGLEGEFVYAWDGTELILLPTAAPDYAELTKLNDQRFKNETVKAKELQIGATYLHNTNTEWVYMGRFDYYDGGYLCSDGEWFVSNGKAIDHCIDSGLVKEVLVTWPYRCTQKEYEYKYAVGVAGQRHCFYDRSTEKFEWPKSLSKLLIDTISVAPAADYPELFENLERTTEYSPYDDTRDELIDYTLEEAKERVDNNNRYWGHTFKNADGAGVQVRRVKNSDGDIGYVCTFTNSSDMTKFFSHRQKQGYSCAYLEMIPVPFEEIFAKFHFYYVKQYLANGKYYRTVW